MIGGKNLSDLLMSLYACPVSDDFFDHVLAVLENYVPATIAGYSFIDLETRRLNKRLWRNRQNDANPLEQEQLNRLFQQHPFMDYYCSNALGPVICITDIMSEEEWKQSEIYDAFGRPPGVVHDVSIRFYAGKHCYCFEFSGAVPLDTNVRRVLNLAAPHLENAYREYMLKQEGFIEGLSDEVVVFSSDGLLLKCSDAVVELLSKYYPEIRADGHRLPKAVRRWVHSEIEGSLLNRGFAANEKLVSMTECQILTLTLIQHAVGYIALLEESARIRPIHILLDLGLTRREAEVLMWIVQGKQNGDIAEILAISTATVRKHVEHVLQKMHCENRGAAVQVVMQCYSERLSHKLPEACHTCVLKGCTNCISEKATAII